MMMEACCSRFTAAEGGARLAAAAATKNILAVEYASFIPVRLLYEKAYQIRGSLFKGSKRSIYITRESRVQLVAFELNILTDLATVAAQSYEEIYDWNAELEKKEVLICTSPVLKQILESENLTMRNINVLIIDSCHLIYRDEDLKYIMQKYKQCPSSDQPTILALTYPLFTSTKKDTKRKDSNSQIEKADHQETEREDIVVEVQQETVRQDAEKVALQQEMGVYENLDDYNMYEKLEWKIEELENELCCQMDLAEDIDGGKRISASVTKPLELIIEYGSKPSDESLPELYKDLETFMKDAVQEALDFIEDHRHDPTEIYGDELYDEFINIPDPTIEPKEMFKQFLYVLDQLGPYAADKAACLLLIKLEKLKIKIPYERHFLLMCLCTTVFVKIRCYADLLFGKYEDEWEKIKIFSSTKVIRFAEILEKFKPPDLRSHHSGLSRHDSPISSQDSRDFSPNKTDNGNKKAVNETAGGTNTSGSLSKSDSCKQMLSDIDKCDFTSLGNKIQDKVNIYESNLKEIHDYPIENVGYSTISNNTPNITSRSDASTDDSLGSTDITTGRPDIKDKIESTATDQMKSTIAKPDISSDTPFIRNTDFAIFGMDIKGNEIAVQQRAFLGFTRRSGHRLRGRTRLQRNNAARVLQMQQNPDALCGIVYMKEALIAKIMFMVIVDMSRCNRRLAYLCVQYCATETPADPGTEPKECQRQGKRQEEVLKKFRMHECNLLLATSALEEGIDLPRCNLVLRWDVPPSYRSYALCRGRARAARSTAALLCSNDPDTTQMLIHNVATYRELDQVISRKCGCGIQDEPPQSEEDHADAFTNFVKPYTPNDNSIINKTCKDISTSKDQQDNCKGNTKSDDFDKDACMDSSNSMDSYKSGREGNGAKYNHGKHCKETKYKHNDKVTCDLSQCYSDEEICKYNDANRQSVVLSKEVCRKETVQSTHFDKAICTENRGGINEFSNGFNNESCEGIIYNCYGDDSGKSNSNKHLEVINNNKIINEQSEISDYNKNSKLSGSPKIINANDKKESSCIENYVRKIADNEAVNYTVDGNNDKINEIVNRCASLNINKELDDRSNQFIKHNALNDGLSKDVIEKSLHNCETGEIEVNHDEIKSEIEIKSAVNEQNHGELLNREQVIDNIDENKDQCNEVCFQIKDNHEYKDKEAKDIVSRIHVQGLNNDFGELSCEEISNNQSSNTSTNNNMDTSNDNTENIPEIANIDENFKETENKSDTDSQTISKDDIATKVYCDKCCNLIICDVCLCTNVSMYYQLIAKLNNISKSDSKKSINDSDSPASVDLSTAIALINRYCAKLPSDTFTRLAPQWWMEEVELPVPGTTETRPAYICTLRLPLNCPVKYNIVGHPMPTKVLARRMVALQACRILHKSGELDDQLMPIGKENFKAVELETSNTMGFCGGSDATDPNDTARPGTTKRRQYYYKRTAWAFTDCQPVVDTSDSEIDPPEDKADVESETEDSGQKEPIKHKENSGRKRNMLYAIVSNLWCALPERYNTRGRRLHAPQNASQAIGILMSRHEPDNLQIPAFPVYTRSGEVRVSVEHVPEADVRMSPRRGRLVRRFMRFVFAEVLRVRRRGMKLQSAGSTHNNYYIVPTVKSTQNDGTYKVDIDWTFLELIYQHTEDKKITDVEKPILWQETHEDPEQKSAEKENNKRKGRKKKLVNPLLQNSEVFVFDADKYREAVVTPWYRNQDQPQFFLVAEICWNLTPDSSFPSASHQSFRDYYHTKYGVTLTQKNQPLLDVDHTSARLNLLTPRYVNRKGVALPVSSERTRRAKRDRLDQKQILIPELCRVHPFAAPLWFATVALPCVLYRINALLIADEIRRAVAIDVGLGIPKINEKTTPNFQWPALDFGWSLAEVLSADSEKNEKKKEEEEFKKEQKEKEMREKEEVERQQKEEEQKKIDGENKEDSQEKTINDILQEKEDAAAAAFEIGTWSNDMASSIPEMSEYDELLEPLPPNLTFCTSASGGTNWCDPIGKPKFNQFNPSKLRDFSMADSDDSYLSSDLDSDDTDLDFDGSDEDLEIGGFCNSKNTNAAMGVRIEYKTAHEAEAVDLGHITKVNPAPMPDEEDDAYDRAEHDRLIRQGSAPQRYIEKFRASVSQHKLELVEKGQLIRQEEQIIEVLPDPLNSYDKTITNNRLHEEAIAELFPFGAQELVINNGQIDVESIERNKRLLLEGMKKALPEEVVKKLNCFSMKDINIDAPNYVNEKVVNVGFDTKEGYEKMCKRDSEFEPYYVEGKSGMEFDFDYQPKLEGHPGPSPSVILQALTMSNANDGINLERLETIGDSFLKFAITAYLYCAHPTVHEGKLSHMRSKQVSNLNLYRLGRNKRLGARMIASKFEPHDNWLPPCHKPPPTLHPRINGEGQDIMQHLETPLDSAGCFIPYNLITQHSIPDKSIADCVEALIGAYLLECGPRGALLFMSWLGIRVLPCHHVALPDDHPYVRSVEKEQQTPETTTPPSPKRNRSASSSSSGSSDDDLPHHQQEVFPEADWSWPGRAVGSLQPYKSVQGRWMQPIFGELKAPPSPLLRYIVDPEGELEQMLSGYDALERTLQYRFQDRSLLLQALTHASHHSNRLTDCYQRLEFLGDAILDYLITRHLYEDPRRHSPGALTDLRSALVNNTIFATLAARHGFHKYFRHMSPGLNEVLTKYVKIQEENGHSISEEHYLIQEDEMEQAEDVEVPKALGDLFESVAGAIFLDSGMSLGAVWKSYVNLMGAELEAFSAAAPKSPVRELLEAEPDTAKFGKPERLADGRRVRVSVEVFGRGTFKGVGRNYRIAKGTAARCALRHLRGRP